MKKNNLYLVSHMYKERIPSIYLNSVIIVF